MRLNKSIRNFRLRWAFLVTAAAAVSVSVPIVSPSPGSSSGEFGPISLLKRIPEVFQARWVFQRRPALNLRNFKSTEDDLEVSESQHVEYTTMDRKMHPPPVPRRLGGQRLPATQPQPPKEKEVKAEDKSADMETAADSYYVVEDYLHGHGPPYHHHDYHHGPPKGYSKGPPKYSYGHYKAEPKGHSYGYLKSEPKAHSYEHHKGHPPKYHGHSSYFHSPPITYHHHSDHSDHSSYFESDGGPPGSPPATNPGGTPEDTPPAPPPSSGPPATSPGDPPGGPPGPQDPPGGSSDAQCAAEIGDKNITQPSDLETSWFLIDDQRVRVDPLIILNPPLVLVPPSPEQISTDTLDTYESIYVERLSMDFEESAKNAGFSIVRDRVTSLNISTVLPKQSEPSGDSVTSVVTIRKLPRLDAPLQGLADSKGYFISALNAAMGRRNRRETISPVENFILSDLHTMTNLFQELWDYEMKPEEIEVNLLASKNENVDVLQMPMMVSRSERRSIPEPDHSERTILDASFNFGLPASPTQFESPSKVVADWKQMMGVGRAKFLTAAEDLVRVYTGMAQFYESLEDFVRTRIVFQRNFGEDSFIRAEGLTQSSFKVRQFLICLDRDNDPSCDSHCAVDPGQFENMLADAKSGSGGGMRPRPSTSSG